MNNLSFSVEKFICTKKEEDLDLTFIPANTRRRLNTFDKHVLFLINNCLDNKVENIILSSQYGEFDRLLKLIEQYKELNEVSPTNFSASVHNYVLGQTSLLNQMTIPTISIAAGDFSFENGLITAITSPQKNVVYCYADNNEKEFFGICLKLSNQGNKYYLNKVNNGKFADLDSIIEFFNDNKKELNLHNYKIERGN